MLNDIDGITNNAIKENDAEGNKNNNGEEKKKKFLNKNEFKKQKRLETYGITG